MIGELVALCDDLIEDGLVDYPFSQLIPKQGWNVLTINNSGELLSVSKLDKSLSVYRDVSWARTSGIVPYLFYDEGSNEYIINRGEEKSERKLESTLSRLDEFFSNYSSEKISAIRKYIENQIANGPVSDPRLVEVNGPSTFQYYTDTHTILEDSNIRNHILQVTSKSGNSSICSVTGKLGTPSRLAMKISGPFGKPGAALVSFNDRAHVSYGWRGNDNCRMTEETVLKYAYALQYMNNNRLYTRWGPEGIYIYAWSTEKSLDLASTLPFILSDPKFVRNDEKWTKFLRDLRYKFRKGLTRNNETVNIVGYTKPNKGRLRESVSYRIPISEFAENLLAHIDAFGEGKNSNLFVLAEALEISKNTHLTNSLLVSVFEGKLLNSALLNNVSRIFKSCIFEYSRKKKAPTKKVVANLDLLSNFIGGFITKNRITDMDQYETLGRRFALYEHACGAYHARNGGPENTAPVVKYVNAFLKNPQKTDNQLQSRFMTHLSGIKKISAGRAIWYSKMFSELTLDNNLPITNMGAVEQAMFFRGYWSQRTVLYTSNNKKVSA